MNLSRIPAKKEIESLLKMLAELERQELALLIQ